VVRPEIDAAARARRTRDPHATCAPLVDPDCPCALASPATTGSNGARAATADRRDDHGEAGEAARAEKGRS
jgi:hypothetical protein